jgi:hypothetical protein
MGMADWPNVLVPNHIAPLLDYIKKVNRPTKVTQEWLASGGFKSSNDRYFLGLLKALGYLDASGTPSDRWDELRGSDADRKASVGRQMAVAYREVFSHYPLTVIANSLSKDELKDFVRPKISAGEPTVINIVSTFWALRALASFDTGKGAGHPGQVVTAITAAPASGSAALPVAPAAPPEATAFGQGLYVSINLSLEIPQTSDPDVYDKLFEAMAKHLGTMLKRAS